MNQNLKDIYGKYFKEMLTISRAPARIDETNVYQEANPDLRKYMDVMLSENFMEGSGLGAPENFKAFYDAVQSGKRGLILMEHYTNLDFWQFDNFYRYNIKLYRTASRSRGSICSKNYSVFF